MAYEDYAESEYLAQPVEIYEFSYGVDIDGTTPLVYRYTDAVTPIEYAGDTYEPLPITRTKIEASGKMDLAELRITVPRTSDIAEIFRVFPPSQVVTVRIRQGHIPDGTEPVSWDVGENFPVSWAGRVLECSREDDLSAILTCEPVGASLKRPGLRRHYQWACPYALYGEQCGATKNAITATVVSVAGNKVTLEPDWESTETPSHFAGGLVEYTGDNGPEIYTILSVSGDTLTLMGAARYLAEDDEVEVSIGCSHTLSSCRDRFDNAVNFGGQWLIPNYNPINKNNHF